MDSGDKIPNGNNISAMMTLPEEALREIFNYLSLETLYFTLRTVCKNINIYVNHYLKFRGTSIFVSCPRGLEKEVIEITVMPKKGFILLPTPASTLPWVASKLQNNEILDGYRDQIRLNKMVLYAAKYRTAVCHIYKSEKCLTFDYDLESEMWLKVLENCTPHKCLDNKGTSYEFIQMLISKIIPHYSEIHSNHIVGYYPFVQVKAKDKTWSVGKIMYCKPLRPCRSRKDPSLDNPT